MIERIWRATFEDNPNSFHGPDYNWNTVPKDLKVDEAHFGKFYYRIGNTMYLIDSEIFRDAFNKDRMWEKLNA